MQIIHSYAILKDMKKLIEVIILLLIIGLTAIFCVLYISFNLLEPENSINQYLRKRIISDSSLRSIFRLHQVGDARYEYMAKRNIPISIHLYYQDGATLTEQTKSLILSRMQFITHKFIQGTLEGPIILRGIPEKVDDEDIKQLREMYAPRFSLTVHAVPLNIFVLHYYTPHPSYAGLVEDDHSIFLFKTAIENVSEDVEIIPSMEISTILHEFAHLGGAEHIDDPNCILIDKVERLDFFNKINSIRDSYCEADIKEIERALLR